MGISRAVVHAAALLAFVGCSSSSSTRQVPEKCTQAAKDLCVGPNDCQGTRVCKSDGSGYQECVCADGGSGAGGTATGGAAGTGTKGSGGSVGAGAAGGGGAGGSAGSAGAVGAGGSGGSAPDSGDAASGAGGRDAAAGAGGASGQGGSAGSADACIPMTILDACDVEVCGSVSDGCTGTYNCGTCVNAPTGPVCRGGQCCGRWATHDVACTSLRPYYFTCGTSLVTPPSCTYYGYHIDTPGYGSAFCCPTSGPG